MNVAVIMAGGEGLRMKAPVPKQYMSICGRPMLSYSMEAFGKNKETDRIYLVCSPEYREKAEEISVKYGCGKVAGYILPGKTRRLSSKNAIDLVYENCPEDTVVMIHDAARPGITDEIINNNIRAVGKTGACCSVILPKDTLCEIEGDCLGKTIPRDKTVQLQTPQTFRLDIIKKAHDNYEKMLEEGNAPEITDDTGLVRLMGIPVATVEGAPENVKMTEPSDIKYFEAQFYEKQNAKRGTNARKISSKTGKMIDTGKTI